MRKNVEGEITLTSYGFNTGLVVDPIEKKPLLHFLRGSKILSFGTPGCNLGCKFCQNWHLSRSKVDPTTLNASTPEQIVEAARQTDCQSVGFTYNEPIIFFEYAIDVARACHEAGIKTVAVTAGYINPAPRAEFFALMDAANIDLKAFDENFYKRNCLIELAPVLETIKYVARETDCHMELTTLLIEGENDDDEILKRQCEWIVREAGTDVPVHFSAFHPAYKFSHKPSTKPQTVYRAMDIAKKAGLKYVYGANI